MTNSTRPARQIAVELFVVSAISLYVELLIIRWMSADVRAFTVFRTFPLISCFVGLGVGMALCQDKSYRLFPVSALAFCLMMQAINILGINTFAFPSLSVFQWGNLAGLVATNMAYIVLILLLMIIMLALPFGLCVTIGARLGVLFNQLDSLTAYGYNIMGAIAGSILFQMLVCLGLPPHLMLLLPLAAVMAYQAHERQVVITGLAALVIIPAAFAAFVPVHLSKPLIPQLIAYQTQKANTFWSPYQKIDLTVLESGPPKPQFVGLELSVNHTFYQYLFNTNHDSPLSESHLLDAIRKDYSLPFGFNKSKSVLIVGAGTGQNVSFALSGGADDVDAVEIDPIILKLGKTYNPDYASTSVHAICDDARHFFSRCHKRYDVIDFSTLDSHTVAGFGSSVRLDAYVYTKESIAKALNLLNDHGVLVVSFATVAPWTRARLYKTFTEAAGYEPAMLEGMFSSSIFILGPDVKNNSISLPAWCKKLPGDLSASRYLTDDWPYIYVQPNVIDYPYLLVVAEILLVSIYAARRHLFQHNEASTWQLFFMGAAFMLIELHAISFLSLLFGSTWVTAALVINGILIMIFLANLLVIKLGVAITTKQPAVYAALIATILISYFLPTEQLINSVESSLAYAILSFFTILPMGVAAIIFSSAFSRVPNASRALAFNLFGAVIGGLLEYLSNYTGIRNLLLVAASLYLCSLVCYMSSSQAKSSKESLISL
jgi:hypothetical protein